jgi:hypothetical protein
MAYCLTYSDLKTKFNQHSWNSFEEFEEYYLQNVIETGNYLYYTNKEGKEIRFEPINHFPELKEYEVWIEGYEATGNSAEAELLGRVKARNFGQACHIIQSEIFIRETKKINDKSFKGKYSGVNAARWDYDPNNFSVWGCKMFWNEILARKHFG